MAYTEASLNINDEFLEDEEVPVFYYTLEFNRKIDIRTGHRQGNIHASLMEVVVQADKKMLLLFDLMKRDEKFDGVITFKRDTDKGHITKTVKFTNAVCAGYRETFEIDKSLIGGMRLNFSFWCETIDLDSKKYNVKWKEESEKL